jgi:hypothetical protein
MSCVLCGLNISFITCADDIFNISRTLDKISETFQKLLAEYLKSGFEFNTDKSDVMFFNWKGPFPHEIVLSNPKI